MGTRTAALGWADLACGESQGWRVIPARDLLGYQQGNPPVAQPAGAVIGLSHSGGSTEGVRPGKCGTILVASRAAGLPSIAGRRSSRHMANRTIGALCK